MTKTAFAQQALGGGVIGAVLGGSGMVLINRGLLPLQDYVPVVLAFIYLLLALTVWINPYIRRTAQPGERLWKRAMAALLSALALAAPTLVPDTMNPLLAYALVVAIYAASALMMRQVIRGLDELTQRVITDTNLVTINVLVVGLFLYGAAERMGYVRNGVSIWVLYSLVLFFQFVWTQIAWMRRGLGNPAVAEE